MDSLLHATRKIMIERATNPQRTSSSEISDVAPPPYTTKAPSLDESFEDDSEDEEELRDPSPMTITLDATTSIQGQGNLVASPALADATRFSALLLAAIQNLNAKAEAEAQVAAADGGQGKVRPTLNVQLVLNCGITVNGDRNVVGYRPSQGGVSAGSKRKAEEDAENIPPCKRIDGAERM